MPFVRARVTRSLPSEYSNSRSAEAEIVRGIANDPLAKAVCATAGWVGSGEGGLLRVGGGAGEGGLLRVGGCALGVTGRSRSGVDASGIGVGLRAGGTAFCESVALARRTPTSSA